MKIEDINFEYDLKSAYFELDVLQEELLKFYVRADKKFRRAYYINYTSQFFQFLKDKAKLKEPIHLSISGNIRGGKSHSAITIAYVLNLLYGRMMDVRYICANAFEFLERIKEMDMSEIHDSCFLIDENKSVYGIGSIAKKSKLTDVQNIIAKQNISTISICPTKFSNQDAFYGLKVFGRDFKQKINRFMLYNLQEGEKGGVSPMGMVYIPIFQKILPKKISNKLAIDYEAKKDEWIERETRGEGDVLYGIKKNTAKVIANDENYQKIKKKDEKIVYISQKLGSEWAKGEITEIYNLANLMIQGIVE